MKDVEQANKDKQCWRCETYPGSGNNEEATHEITFPNGSKGYCCEMCWHLHAISGYKPVPLKKENVDSNLH